MSAPSSCPAPDRLRRLLDDTLPPAEQAELTAHLDTCPHCRLALDSLAAGSEAPTAAVLLAQPPPPPEDSLLRVLAELRSNPDQAVARRPGPREQWVLSFLSPPSTAGTLGRLGDYDVLEVLGQGGMGIVLKAFDPSLRRTVAIKVLAPHLASDPNARQRFAREARSAAAVHHENVVTIHAVAEANGLPFLVMEYVAGGSLQDHLDRHGALDPVTVVRIGAQAAAGLAAAHAQGLVHRDIKPANLLLQVVGQASSAVPAEEDRRGRLSHVVKITDFGLARAADEISLTQSGVVTGTPLYMAPEQALGETVGPRADLFSLGSVLYACATGRPPFRPGAPMAVLRQVCDTDPTPIRELAPSVPAWLAEVIAALHARKPEQRFPSAAELADLLRRHLAHLEEPARVPPPSDTDRRLRQLRRRPRRRLALAGLAVLLLLLGVGLYLFWGRPRRPRPLLELTGHDGPIWALAFAPDQPLLASGGNDRTVRLWSALDGSEAAPPVQLRSPVWGLAFSRAGGLRAIGTDGGSVGLWPASPDAGAPRAICHRLPTRALAFSPDGKTLAVATGKQVDLLPVDRLLALGTGNDVDVSRLGKLVVLPHRHSVWAVAWAPDGRFLVSGDTGGQLRAWSPDGTARQGPALPVHDRAAVRSLAFHPAGRLLASAGEDETVRLWDTTTWQEAGVLRGHRNGVLAVAFAPDGAVLASGSRDRTVKLWDVETQREVATLPGHGGAVWAVAFGPDGRLVASAGEDKVVRIWDMTGFTER